MGLKLGKYIELRAWLHTVGSLRSMIALLQFLLIKLLSLATPPYTVAQIAEHFKPNTVLWTFLTIQPTCYLVWLKTLI